MGSLEAYNQLMRDSNLRLKAVKETVGKIVSTCKTKTITENIQKEISDVLCNYDVEEGVTVFLIPVKPNSKKLIAKIDIGKEFMFFWWGKNLKAGNNAKNNKYALGITYVGKKSSDLFYYSIEELVKEYPEFKNFFYSYLRVGERLKISIYSTAGAFYKATKKLEGEWLLQTPNNGYFIPYRPIGKVANRELHFFHPGIKMRVEKSTKLIEVR